jgi:hypothetical protein
MRAMWDMHADFTFDVSLAHAERFQNYGSQNHGIPFNLEDALPNSCVLHEHLVRSKEQYRDRIHNNPHIFATLVDACVQDALGMDAEQGEE